MKNYYRFYILFVISLFSYSSYAGVIKGRITDSKGETLPYATVYIQGTTIGTSANSAGEYMINIVPGNYKIVCQYIGFRQSVFDVTVKGDETIEHQFKLQDQNLQMKEVVVKATAEDPAYRIIRKAIEKRKFHLQQVKSFQTGIYLKGVFRSRKMPDKIFGQKIEGDGMEGLDSNKRGVLYLCEEDADYYSDGDKERTVIHSVRESGDPSGYGFSRFPSVITFYENNVDILGGGSRGFISPVSDNAISFYKYKLEGEFFENDHIIYKIKVSPRRLYEPVFTGTIYIVEGDWAIHTINMFVTKTANLDFLDTLGVQQLFLPLKPDTWVAKNQILYFTIGIFGFDATASIVTVYNKQKVNERIPDTIFKKNIVSSYDKTANKKDTSYWTQNRPIPLQTDEIKDYRIKDSIMKIVHTPEYLDSIRRKQNTVKIMDFLLGGYTFHAKKNKNIFSIDPVLFSINYNTVEGANLSPKLYWRHRIDTGYSLRSTMALRYGFNNTHLNAISKLEYVANDRTWIKRSRSIGIQGGKYIFQYNPESPVSIPFNTVSTLFWRDNDLKLYERWDATAYYTRNYGNGLHWTAKLSYQQRLPVDNTTNYSFGSDKSTLFSANYPMPHFNPTLVPWGKHDALIANFNITWQPGYEYTEFPDYKVGSSSWPVFSLNYIKGIPNIFGSKTDYDKWNIGVQDNLRLKLWGSLSYNLIVGGFLNRNYISIPDMTHLYGNRGIGFASSYLHSFQFAQYYEFSNIEPIYAEAHLEYNMLGLFSNKIPLLRQARWYMLLGTNSFYASDKTYYAEAFLGIDNLGWKMLRFLRVDFVQSWDSHNGANSGIRFGLKPIGSVNIKYTNDEEW